MAAKRRRYDNMDGILDKLLDSDCSDLDDDWEYESEDERVLCGGNLGDADSGGVVGDADVVGADVGGGVGDADCGAGSSVVRDRSIGNSVCKDSGDECSGLVGGDDDDQSDNDDVDSGVDGDCLCGDDGGPDCLHGGVRVRSSVRGRSGVRVRAGHFCGVGGSGRGGGCIHVGGHGRRGVCVHGGVYVPEHGLGVHVHGVADLLWESVDNADE